MRALLSISLRYYLKYQQHELAHAPPHPIFPCRCSCSYCLLNHSIALSCFQFASIVSCICTILLSETLITVSCTTTPCNLVAIHNSHIASRFAVVKKIGIVIAVSKSESLDNNQRVYILTSTNQIQNINQSVNHSIFIEWFHSIFIEWFQFAYYSNRRQQIRIIG